MTVPQPKKRSLVQVTIPWLVLCVPMVTASEGVRYIAYRDPVRIPTICMGETLGVRLGDVATPKQCTELLQSRLLDFEAEVRKCVPNAVMGPYRTAGIVSFTYNIGIGAFCKSTLAKKLNSNDPNACAELSKWVRAGPLRIVLPGLVTRRKVERKYCEAG